jgi:hypothetical protein
MSTRKVSLLKNKYTFEYTSTKAVAFLVFSGLFSTIGISIWIVKSHIDNTASALIAVLIMYPVMVFSLKRFVIRKGSAIKKPLMFLQTYKIIRIQNLI